MFQIGRRPLWLRVLLVLVVVVCFSTGLTQWRRAYVAWEVRSARSLLSMGDSQDVQAALRGLQAARGIEHPDRPELLFLLGRAERRTGNFENAFDCLDRARQEGWPAEEIQQQVQLARLQRGHFEELQSSQGWLTSRSVPDDFAYEAYEAIAKGYLYAYRFGDALQCLGYWLEWCPDAIEPREMRARIWEQAQDWGRANEEYRAILSLDASHREARLALAGNMLLRLNEVQNACREFQYCLKEYPDEVSAVLGLAACERRLGDPQSAEQRLRDLLKRSLSPDQQTNAEMELGQILVDRQELVEATQLLTQAVEADPRNNTAWYALGCAYAAAGQSDKSTTCFERSRVLQEQLGRLGEITTELVSHPERSELRWEAGKILMDQGLFKEGAGWLSTVLMYDPHHQPTHEALADYYENVKHDPRMAAHHRQEALRTASGALN